ncbi:MAG TPA: hypothetical protein VLS89_20795, partial [Candidatus Nanopelagicales bacterium]|nr:hypothetical protein [Candidatus Nanopelagicales bacterium]
EGRFAAVVTSVEFLRRATDVAEATREIVRSVLEDSRKFLPAAEQAPDPLDFTQDALRALNNYLSAWSAACPRPIVLFIDEIDSLPEDLLLNVLGQLRMGYTARPAAFVHSLALVGVRDVLDYRARLRPDDESMGTASPFNVKSDSLTLRNFSHEEVAELYAQHTADTGQVFHPEAVDRAFEQTQGQPWLVNAIAREIVRNAVPDRSQPITAAHVDAAREALILRRDTHLDSLVDKLREERVRRVIEPILAGEVLASDVLNDDLMYVRDLGLVRTEPSVRIANPIYQEIIPRSLTYVLQRTMSAEASWYTRPDGSLDMRALLRAFQEFFAEHSEAWLERYDYKEAGPHLILMAFLQRVVNGGGQIQREMAIGSGRVDLVVGWRGYRYAIELKVRRGERTLGQGIQQLSAYLARLGLDEGYLVLFDRRADVRWEEKLYEREVEGVGGKRIVVFGA